MNPDPGQHFEDYLFSKKINSDAFRLAEPEVWSAWKNEFEQIHPGSFTVQKLNLINPVRRKYPLPVAPEVKSVVSGTSPVPSAKPGKPVMRPKQG